MKLSQQNNGPFKVLKRIGEVVYIFELLALSLLNLVFHVTTLKKMDGEPQHSVDELPSFDEEGGMSLKPKEAIC